MVMLKQLLLINLSVIVFSLDIRLGTQASEYYITLLNYISF